MRSLALRRTSTALVAAALLVLAGGCGDDSGDPESATETTDAPTDTPSPSEPATAAGPDCATIWVEGGTLEKTYAGCTQDGATVAVEKVGCSSGQTFVLFNDEFWAVKGGLIKHAPDGLTESDAYLEDMAACRG